MTGLSNSTTTNGWSTQPILFDTMTSEESTKERMNSNCVAIPPSRPKARRRSSCSALPSNGSWEPTDDDIHGSQKDYGNFIVSLESKSNTTIPLGTFLRSNSHSFSVSSQSDSDTSICGLSGDEYASDSNENKPTIEKKKKKSRKKKLSKDIPDTSAFPSKNEISIHRQMTRRSSWSGAVSPTYPDDDAGILKNDKLLNPTEVETPADVSLNLEGNIPEQSLEPIHGVYHDESMAPPQQSTTSTRRRMNRRSSWHAATHFSTEQKDGVITSFKLSHSKTVMYEETLVDVENSECLPNYNSVQLEEEKMSIQHTVPIDSIHSAPALLSDYTCPEKEFKRSLLMAKHIQSGATRAQRRASWSGSTTNYLDYAEQTNNSVDQVQRSTRELFVDIISTCKKQAKYVPHDEDEQPYALNSLPIEDPTQKGYQETDPSVVSNAATQNSTLETSTNRAQRRASWHSSCSQENLISTSTLNTQYSQQSQHSQKFVMDLSHPQKNWITKDWIEGDENDEMEEDGVGSDHKSTTSGTSSHTSKSRSWILGKGNGSSRHMIPKTSSNLVVVSNANMPHPGQACLEPLEDTPPDVGFVQLTAFGDVTVIGHDE